MDALIAPLWMGISLFWIVMLAWRWNRFPTALGRMPGNT